MDTVFGIVVGVELLYYEIGGYSSLYTISIDMKKKIQCIIIGLADSWPR